MKFKDASTVWNVVQVMVQADAPRSRNRMRINQVFNGNPPYTEAEASENHIETNVNFLEGTRIIHHARQSFSNAFLKQQNFFTVNVDTGPAWKRGEWGRIITTNINRAMKRSHRYLQAMKSQFAGVVLHGIGPSVWVRDRDWCPKARGVDDVFVPSSTLVSMENLDHFAVYTTYTAAQLVEMTRGPYVDPGWNKGMVDRILASLNDQATSPNSTRNLDLLSHPEKAEEDFKSNSGYWGSDAVPAIRCYDFYFQDTEQDVPVWKRRIIVDRHSGAAEKIGSLDEFLFDPGDRDYGRDVGRIMHVHFGDGSVVPPFRWHSVRSLGYLLYAVCHLQNRMRCKFTDAVFESMLWYFRTGAEPDAERLEMVNLHHLGVIPNGLQWVPANERHKIDGDLVGSAMQQYRQLMSESSASFTQDVSQQDGKEMTATEAMARVNNSNALLGSMLSDAYLNQEAQYSEIFRRFCLSDHPECVEFRKRCIMEGVPQELFSAAWNLCDIQSERVLGSGNRVLEMAQADKLMAIRPLLKPDAQQVVLHKYVEVYSDAALASLLVPIEQQPVSPSAEIATLSWGTLIDGKPVMLASEINNIELVETLLAMLAQDIQRIENDGGMVDARRIMGLANVMQFIESKVALIAQDEQAQDRVKQYMDALGQAANMVKAYEQRLVEQMQAQQQQGPQMDPQTAGKIQAMTITAESKARIDEARAAQKMQHKQEAFDADQQRKNVTLMNDLERQGLQTKADIAETDVRTQADILRQHATENT